MKRIVLEWTPSPVPSWLAEYKKLDDRWHANPFEFLRPENPPQRAKTPCTSVGGHIVAGDFAPPCTYPSRK